MSNLGATAHTRIGKNRKVRQFNTLGAAIECMEPRFLLSAAPPAPHPHDDPSTIDYAEWLDQQLNETTDNDNVDPIVYGTQTDPPPPDAPALSGTIESTNFDTQASNSGFFFIPPDNSMAVGPSHVVTVVNCVLQVYNKSTGSVLLTQRLGKNSSTATGSFFASLSPTTPTFDPKVIYDQFSNRFVVVSLEQSGTTNNVAGNISRILLAVSQTSDPTGAWNFTAINTKAASFSFNGGAVSDRWLDYPGFAIDNNAVYITGNLFSFAGSPGFGGSRLVVVNKTGFYTGGAVTSNIYDPSVLSGIKAANGIDLFTMQPAHIFGSTPAGAGTYLVSSGIVDGSHNDYLSVVQVNNPTSSPTFTNTFVNFGNVDDDVNGLPLDGTGHPAAPQAGTSTGVATNDKRVINAVWRNNNLYAANTTAPASGSQVGQATARWYKMSANFVAAPTVADTGIVDGEDIASTTSTFFPSVNVDSANNMAISFSASAPTIFPGAYYTGRLAGDPAGTVQPSGVLAAGTDFYVRKFASNGGVLNRWGDYSATEVDPSNDSTFYTFNQYALTRGTVLGGEDGRWGTRVGNFSFVVSQSISGQVFQDNNGDASFSGEPTLNGVTVFLDNDNSGTLNAGDTSVVTAGSGNFSFPGLANGLYHLREIAPSGYIQDTAQADISLSGSSVVFNIGNFPITFPVAPATGAGNDNYNVSLNGTGLIEQINDGSTTYTILKANLASSVLTFNGNAGDDTLTLDFTNGSPIPTAGMTFAGGTQTTGDTLAIVGGASTAETATFNAATVVVAGTTFSDSGVETFTFNGNGGSDNVTVNSGTVLFPATQVFSTLSLANGTSAQLTGGANKVLVVTTLNIGAGAKLDLTDNDAIVKNGTLLAIQSLDGAGYNGGLWTGTSSITSSTAAAVAANPANIHKTALGFAKVSATTLGATFDGQSIVAADVVIRYTDSGDANLDGNTDTQDFTLLASNFNGSTKTWSQADFTFNGLVNAIDFNNIATNFGQVLPAPPAPGSPFSNSPIDAPANVIMPSLWDRDPFARNTTPNLIA